MAETTTEPADGGRLEDRDSALSKLLTGRSDIDFVGRSRLWLMITIAIVVLCLAELGIRGLNFSIEFTGGSSFVWDPDQPLYL